MVEAEVVRELETLFLALADKTRLRLLGLLAEGSSAVGDLAVRLGESQPKISRHLAALRSSGVVATRREGKHIYYALRMDEQERTARVLAASIDALSSKYDYTVQHGGRDIYDDADMSSRFDDQAPQQNDQLEIFLL